LGDAANVLVPNPIAGDGDDPFPFVLIAYLKGAAAIGLGKLFAGIVYAKKIGFAFNQPHRKPIK